MNKIEQYRMSLIMNAVVGTAKHLGIVRDDFQVTDIELDGPVVLHLLDCINEHTAHNTKVYVTTDDIIPMLEKDGLTFHNVKRSPKDIVQDVIDEVIANAKPVIKAEAISDVTKHFKNIGMLEPFANEWQLFNSKTCYPSRSSDTSALDFVWVKNCEEPVVYHHTVQQFFALHDFNLEFPMKVDFWAPLNTRPK